MSPSSWLFFNAYCNFLNMQVVITLKYYFINANHGKQHKHTHNCNAWPKRCQTLCRGPNLGHRVILYSIFICSFKYWMTTRAGLLVTDLLQIPECFAGILANYLLKHIMSTILCSFYYYLGLNSCTLTFVNFAKIIIKKNIFWKN